MKKKIIKILDSAAATKQFKNLLNGIFFGKKITGGDFEKKLLLVLILLLRPFKIFESHPIFSLFEFLKRPERFGRVPGGDG